MRIVNEPEKMQKAFLSENATPKVKAEKILVFQLLMDQKTLRKFVS